LKIKLNIKYRFYAFLIICLCEFLFSCGKQVNTKTKSNADNKITFIDSLILTEKQKKILSGARKCLKDRFNYDTSMEYYVLTYRNGEDTGKKV